MKKLTTLMLLIILFLITVQKTTAQSRIPISEIRSVTYIKGVVWEDEPGELLLLLEQDIGVIKSLGFNTVWLALPWMHYQERALPEPPIYNEENFQALNRILTLLEENEMYALISLDYFWYWNLAPEGIEEPWLLLTNETYWNAYKNYCQYFASKINSHHNFFLFFHAEGIEPGNETTYGKPQCTEYSGSLMAEKFGSMPAILKQAGGEDIPVGFHDWCHYHNSPVPEPNPYDFLSIPVYPYLYPEDYEYWKNNLTKYINYVKNKYPLTPILVGELGAHSNWAGEENQKYLVSYLIEGARSNNAGVNVWMYQDFIDETSPIIALYGLLRVDGSFKPVTDALWSDCFTTLLSAEVSPKTVSPESTFNLSCGFTSPVDCIFPFGASHCVFTGNNETTAYFSCKAGSQTGTYEAGCVAGLKKITTTYQIAKLGDLNNDEHIDIHDLAIIGTNFGKTNDNIDPPEADINNDNVVNILDLYVVAKNLGT